MKKIHVGIITYNNPTVLQTAVEHLFSSDLVLSGKYDWNIEIINNHSNFSLSPDLLSRVTVHHQTLRPDWAYVGYFTRDCNSILVRSIKNLKAPLVDQVLILQDDVFVKPDFMQRLVDIHDSGIEFLMSGIGDALNSFLPEAVRKVGLYDERLHTGFHEGDYILRAIQKLGKNASIGDIAHGRVWNQLDNGKFYTSNSQAGQPNPDASIPSNTTRAESDLVTCPPFTQDQLFNVSKRHGTTDHYTLWKHKWGNEIPFYNWSSDFMENVIPTLKQKSPNYILYPYFEKDIYNILSETYQLRVPEAGIVIDRPLYPNIIYYGPGEAHEW